MTNNVKNMKIDLQFKVKFFKKIDIETLKKSIDLIFCNILVFEKKKSKKKVLLPFLTQICSDLFVQIPLY